ncbi:MAG: hypothetical protein OXR66_06415 [Candidatus Woesearchaeota archaeon]|nr:hypothetical protein [Candidatus Woesearchaeota archaeon]
MKYFDLLGLHSETDSPKGWIWARLQAHVLQRKYFEFLRKRTQDSIASSISKRLNCGFSTVQKHLIRLKKSEEVVDLPLPLLLELTNIFRIKRFTFEYLYTKSDTTRKKVNPITQLSPTLAKIVGGFAADGYMQYNNGSYRLKIVDGDETSIRRFAEWIHDIFGIQSNYYYYKEDHAWLCWFNNKVVARYFEKFFSIRPGKKSHIAHKPRIIQGKENERAFALGVLQFDGGVKATGMAAFTTKSKQLMEDVARIVRKDGLKIITSYNKKKKFYLLESRTGRDKEQLKKWLMYFEPGTRKHDMLKFLIRGKKMGIKELLRLFPKHYSTRLSVLEVYNAIKSIKKGYNHDIVDELKQQGIFVSWITIYKHLHLLSQAKLLRKEKASMNRVLYSVMARN